VGPCSLSSADVAWSDPYVTRVYPSTSALALLVALALAVGSCGDSGTSDGVATGTTFPRTVGGRFEVVEPVHQVDPLPGSGGMYGSGCTPGSSILPDGIWFGEWASVSATSVEFDLECFGPGPEGPGNVVNTNPQLRSVPIHPDAVVWSIGDNGTHGDPVTYDQWLANPHSEFCGQAPCPVWLYINDGQVTEIVELFFA